MSDERPRPPTGERKVPPNPDRPRLPEYLEAQFVDVDERSSEIYTALEDRMQQLATLAEDLAGGRVVVPAPETDTAVHRLSIAAHTARKPDPDDAG